MSTDPNGIGDPQDEVAEVVEVAEGSETSPDANRAVDADGQGDRNGHEDSTAEDGLGGEGPTEVAGPGPDPT